MLHRIVVFETTSWKWGWSKTCLALTMFSSSCFMATSSLVGLSRLRKNAKPSTWTCFQANPQTFAVDIFLGNFLPFFFICHCMSLWHKAHSITSPIPDSKKVLPNECGTAVIQSPLVKDHLSYKTKSSFRSQKEKKDKKRKRLAHLRGSMCSRRWRNPMLLECKRNMMIPSAFSWGKNGLWIVYFRVVDAQYRCILPDNGPGTLLENVFDAQCRDENHVLMKPYEKEIVLQVNQSMVNSLSAMNISDRACLTVSTCWRRTWKVGSNCQFCRNNHVDKIRWKGKYLSLETLW